MRVVITGAGGQLGQDLVHACKRRDIIVHAANSHHLDITDYLAVEKYLAEHSCDVLFNCAAYNEVDQAERNSERAFRINGIGVQNLARGINEFGGIFVHYSTDYVFDGEKRQPYTTIDRPHPINKYGESKLLGEHYVRDLAERYFLIRVSWLFGAGPNNFAQKVIEWSKTSNELRIVDDQVSSPTYTRDLAEASLDLVDKGMYGLYHLSNSGSCSRYEWASYILMTLGWQGAVLPASSEDFPTPARRPAFSVLDTSTSHEILGYSLPDWKDATKRFLREQGAV
jgi:dTDP-4-dehydrorhamnose reductase